MSKKVIAVVLAVLLLFAFCSDSFTVKAGAVVGIDDFIIVTLAELGFAWAASQFADLAGGDICDYFENVESNGKLAQDYLLFDPATMTWSVDQNVEFADQGEKEFLENLADVYNGKKVYVNVVGDYVETPTVDDFNNMVSGLFNTMVDYCTSDESHNSSVHYSDSGGKFGGGGRYRGATLDFDLLGGSSYFTVPASQTEINPEKAGFWFSPRGDINTDVSGYLEYFKSIDERSSIATKGGTKYIKAYFKDYYGGGQYCIYNNKVYYRNQDGYQSNGSRDGYYAFPPNVLMKGNVKPAWFVALDGTNLSDYFPGDNNGYFTEADINQLSFGIWINVTGEYRADSPAEHVSYDDFYSTSGADYIELTKNKHMDDIAKGNEAGLFSEDPTVTIDSSGNIAKIDGISTDSLSDNIDTIVKAQALGIISDKPSVETDEEGNITAVDGIDIDKLKELTDGAIDSGLDFEDFEQYYKQIVTLLKASNTDTTTMNNVLRNIRSKQIAISGDVSAIRNDVKAIAEALTIDAALEDEYSPQEDEFSFLTVEHTGLSEAEDLVDRLPIVNQTKSLLGALFDENNFNESAPSFVFYWDSNGDGQQETYTALDLSFLETTLTNNNLEDKNRYQKPMTVREFIQLLIIFSCYVAFFMKAIKKLPSLFGGSDGFDGNVKGEVKSEKIDVV